MTGLFLVFHIISPSKTPHASSYVHSKISLAVSFHTKVDISYCFFMQHDHLQ